MQLRIQPVGSAYTLASFPAVLDFWSTFDNYPGDQGPRRSASIVSKFSGGVWGNETLSFHVGIGTENDSAVLPLERMRITGAGNVGIGTTTPGERLSVNGKIRAQEVKVKTANWPDYVFDQDYKILGLQELDAYIKANKHLPDVPSAAVLEKEGLPLGEMNRLLMKKIEELTLHLIDLKNQSDTKMEALSKQVEQLKNRKNKNQL